MKNNNIAFRAIVSAQLNATAKTLALIFRLERLPETELVYHLQNENKLMLFIATCDQHAYEQFLAGLKYETGIASYNSWPLSPVRITIPTYEPRTWLLSTL